MKTAESTTYDIAICPRVPSPASSYYGDCSDCRVRIFWSEMTESMCVDVPRVCVPCGRKRLGPRSEERRTP